MKYRARRRVTSFDVTVSADGGKRPASIADITESGARLRLEYGNLEEGTLVAIAIHGQDWSAQVIWNKEGECGVAFDQILPLDVLAAVNRSLHRPSAGKKKRFLMQ